MATMVAGICNYAQDDIGVIALNSPESGCELGTETVQVDIFNFGDDIGVTSFDVSFQVDDDPVISQTQTYVSFNSGETKIVTFFVGADLSEPGPHTLKVYTEFPGDANNDNDTITVEIINFPPSDAGVLLEDATLCEGSSDTLILDGSVGDILNWESSTDGGGVWLTIASTDTFLVVNDLTETTMYRARAQSGTCPEDFSNEITLTIDAAPVGGEVEEDATVCIVENSGTLNLVDYEGTVEFWQFDDGAGWMDLAVTDDFYDYADLTETTQFRAVVGNGVCDADTSDFATITVLPENVGGTLAEDQTVCEGMNDGVLTLSGHIGDIVQWESSIDDGGSWVPIVNMTPTQTFSDITTTTLYRVLVGASGCPSVYSDTVTISVDPAPEAGAVTEDQAVCILENSGTLNLIDYEGTIEFWQFNEGAGWMDLAVTEDSYDFTDLTTTTEFRVVVGNGVCDADTSDIATVTVTPEHVGGTIAMDNVVCLGMNDGTLTLSGFTGDISQWELSEDGGGTWIPIVNMTPTQTYNDLTITTQYRVLVGTEGCPSVYSDTATITVVLPPDGGFIIEDKSVCAGADDTLFLADYTGMVDMWQFNDGGGWTDILTTSDTLFVFDITETTSYRAIVTNNICPNDTSEMATITVIETTVGGTIVESDSVCKGINAATMELVGHVGDIRWWEQSINDGVTWSPIANITTSQGYVDLEETTWYRVLVEGTNCPNEYSDTAFITVYEPEIEITANGETSFCLGDSVELVATTGYEAYLWSTGSTEESIFANEDGFHVVTITDERGCMNSDSIDITVFELPIADAGMDVTISLGQTIALNGSGGVEYLWSPEISLDNATLQMPMATPLETTIYTLVVTDENGCIDSDSVEITVNKDYNFKPNNIITPNGDGFNDVWIIDNIQAYPETKVIVVNRYGQVVYEQVGYTNTWTGELPDGNLVDGTYYYVIESPDSEIIYKGHLTILSK